MAIINNNDSVDDEGEIISQVVGASKKNLQKREPLNEE
jgi:hypothetical protein